jgi:hypothetical protein
MRKQSGRVVTGVSIRYRFPACPENLWRMETPEITGPRVLDLRRIGIGKCIIISIRMGISILYYNEHFVLESWLVFAF